MALQRVNSLCTRMPQKHPTPPRRSTTEGKILLKSKREIDGLILFQKNLKLFDRNIYDNTSAKIFTRSRLNTLNGVAPVRAVPTNKTVNKKITKARSKVTNKPAANDHRTNKAGLNTQDNSEAAEPVLPPSPAPANIPQHEFQRTMTSIGAVFAAEPKTSQLRIENDAFDLTVFPFAVEFYPLYTGITFAKLANCIGIVYMKPLAIRKWSFLKKTHLNVFMISGTMTINIKQEEKTDTVHLNSFSFLKMKPQAGYQMINNTEIDAVCLIYSQ